MSPAALPFADSPSVLTVTAGVCRACGVAEGDEAGFGFVERDLCSVCHSPALPTRRQACEIARIEDRHGPARISRGPLVGELDVALTAEHVRWPHAVHDAPTLLTLAPSGRVLSRTPNRHYDPVA